MMLHNSVEPIRGSTKGNTHARRQIIRHLKGREFRITSVRNASSGETMLHL
jgi:hypothetical protein